MYVQQVPGRSPVVSQPSGYLFALTINISNQPIATVHVRAQTYDQAVDRAGQAIKFSTPDYLIPSITLD